MIKTRFAPSPTGFLHIGGLRTALFAYLFAKRNGGHFVLRVEDTDQERFVEGGMENIARTLVAAGLHVDEGVYLNKDGDIAQKGDCGPYIQSERLPIYQEYIKTLLEKGHAYYAFDSAEELDAMREGQQLNKQPPRYERMKMKNQFTLGEDETRKILDNSEAFVIRLKIPEHVTVLFDDVIRGEISIESEEVDDQVLMKSDGFPTYHFAVVVDDHLMGITHVIRGEEWIPSTPKHILLYKAFGWDAPRFAHLPLLVNEQKQKLSKRHGDVSVEDFIEKGYLMEALINFLALLGWNPGDEREIFSLRDLEKTFDIGQVGKAAAVFNREKLDWFNKQYLMDMPLHELTVAALPFFINAGFWEKDAPQEGADFDFLQSVVDMERPRVCTLAELPQEVGFVFADALSYEAELLVWKKSSRDLTKQHLTDLVAFFDVVKLEDWTKAVLEDLVMPWIAGKNLGNGDVLWPMRVALSGLKNSPGPFEIAAVLGKDTTLARLTEAVELL